MNGTSKDLMDRNRNGRPTLGVELDRDRLGLVLIHHGIVQAWANIPYPADLTLESEGFPAFLKRSLESCIPVGRPVWIWALGSFPSMQLRFFSLPRTRSARLSNMAYWTFRKESHFDAAQTIFDYDVEGEPSGKERQSVNVTAYTAQHAEVEALCGLFKKAGVQLRGIVIPHFALRNLFRADWLEFRDVNLGLFVGTDASTVQILSAGRVALSRVFITGMNAILEVLRDRHPEWSPAEAFGQLRAAEQAEPSELQDVTRAPLGRLMQQIERSMSAFLLGPNTEEIKRIYVAGTLATFPRLVKAMGRQWGVRTEVASVVTSERLAAGVTPPNSQEAALLTMAAGVALSATDATPSLLHTYVQRERECRMHKTRRLTVAVSAALVALLIGGYATAEKRNHWKAGELAVLNDRLEQYPAELTRGGIDQMIAEAFERRLRLRELSKKSRPLALLSRVAMSTPEDIRLTAVRIAPPGRADTLRPAPTLQEQMAVEGMVCGLPETQESRLAAYVMRLEDDTLFADVSVVRTVSGSDGTQPVLLFEMALRAAASRATADASTPNAKELP